MSYNENLGDSKLDVNPEPSFLPRDITAIEILSMDNKEMISAQSIGEYDNIGLSFTKNNIGDYISKYSEIGRSLYMTVLHNSGTAAKYDKGLDTVKSFNTYHLSKGWKTIGYHWIISTEGIIYAGRKMEYIGAHAGSNGNSGSIGVCLVGNFEGTDKPTEKQKEAFTALHLALHKKFYSNKDLYMSVRFHREFMSTGCPGNITLSEVRGWIKENQEKPTEPTSIGKVIVDGVEIGDCLLIDSISYVKPRDFEKAGYTVGWDPKTKTVLINKPKL